MLKNRSVPTNLLLPHLTYPDVAEAVAWLARSFGFEEHYRYGAPGGPVEGAQMHIGEAWIMLSRPKQGRTGVPAELGCHTQSLTIFVEDVDSLNAHAKNCGVTIVEELNETAYGERQFGAEDLAGHRWLFSCHVRDVAPTEWGATLA